MSKTKVSVIATENDYALVEYFQAGDIHRVSVLAEEVKAGEVNQSALDKGIQYGVPWDEVFPGLDNLSWEMHRRQIWTWDDAKNNPIKAKAAVVASTGKITKTILEGGSI